MSVNKPNMVLPLASSYNERGYFGAANTVTAGIDQRKVNSMYEPARNSMTGRATLYLTKRPGVIQAYSNLGSASDVPYLITPDPSSVRNVWMFTNDGTDLRVKNDAGTQKTIVNGSTRFPVYVDQTLISGVRFAVLQVFNTATNGYTTYYEDVIGDSWPDINDAEFTALSHIGKMEHVDGYALQLTENNRIYNSDLNSLSSWSGSYITKGIEQDASRGLARLGQLILAFGTETVEGFYNAGNATGSPLARMPQLSQRIGIVTATDGAYDMFPLTDGSRHYYATLGRKIYFLGRRASFNAPAVFAFDGSSFDKISTPFIEKLFNDSVLYHVCPYLFGGQSAIAFLLTTPSTATQRWLMYFPDWNDWFEWTSTVFQPTNGGGISLGIGGAASANDLFTPYGQWTDAGTAYSMIHQFKLPSEGNHRKFMPMFGVIGDTARSASSLSVEFSDDDWQTYSTARTIDMTSADKMLFRCGSYKDRGVRLTHSGALECRLEAAIARVQ